MGEISKKKIIFCITKSNWGGAQKYVYDLATSLPQQFFEVIVIFGEGGQLEERLKNADIRTIRISSLKRDVGIIKDLSVFFELKKIFKKERPDVVHLNSTKMGAIGAIVGRICRVPKIIFTAHGWAFNEKRTVPSRILIAFIQWLTVLISHLTIAVSQITANQILRFPYVRREKIVVIYNGIAEPDFTSRDESRRVISEKVRENRDFSPGELVEFLQSIWIGTISELHLNKGLDLAIKSFSEINKKYPKSRFIVIGEGEQEENLKNLIRTLRLENQVFLLGFLPDANKYLKAFDIFTLTSRTEALPYALLEAGLAALPVVGSEVGGVPEILTSEEVGKLISVKNRKEDEVSAEIIEKIEYYILHPAQAKESGQNLKHLIATDFSLQKMRIETFALYA